MSAASSNNVTEATFLSWGTCTKDFGYTQKTAGGKKPVLTKLWCKLCAKYEKDVYKNPKIKGAARQDIGNYIQGITSSITKNNFFRHINGAAHQVAITLKQQVKKKIFAKNATYLKKIKKSYHC